MSDANSLRNSRRPLHAIGLMSGTSLDGIDAALLVTDGEAVAEPGPALTVPYRDDFRARLRRLLGQKPSLDAMPTVRELTDLHAHAVQLLVRAAGMTLLDVDVVGFHGQTVWHRPEARETIQIGDGAWLAERLGVCVVDDFRSADVRAGGEGAPLVPLFHAAMTVGVERPLACLNIGGVANISWIGTTRGDVELLAFDTGPGNALIDDWVLAHTGATYDADGRLAAAGRVERGVVARWLEHPYFGRRPPKSLDRDAFRAVLNGLDGASLADGAATLTALSAAAVGAGLKHLPQAPRRWLLTGGGRRNPVLSAWIADAVGAEAEPIEAIGWNGDFVEAQAFAFLAVRALRRLPLTLPTTTGVPAPQVGGNLHVPSRRPQMA